jgi:hypothetical protein
MVGGSTARVRSPSLEHPPMKLSCYRLGHVWKSWRPSFLGPSSGSMLEDQSTSSRPCAPSQRSLPPMVLRQLGAADV